MRILVRSPNWIGDCIMAVPALRALNHYFPGSEIGIVCKSNLQDLFENIPGIDTIIPLNRAGGLKNFFQAVGRIRSWKSDAGVLFTNSFHSALLFKASGIKDVIGYVKEGRGVMLNRRLKFPRFAVHQVDFYLNLVQEFARACSTEIAEENSRFTDEIKVDDLEIINLDTFLCGCGVDTQKRMVGVSASAAYGSSKEWLPERFAELIIRLSGSLADTQFLFFGSDSERKKTEWISEQSPNRAFNLAGRLSLKQAVAAISRCDLFISNDSGLMHVASSLRIPLVALFGPTSPKLTAPRSGMVTILHHPVECAPCNYRECPLDHRCMTRIEVDEVLEASQYMLTGRQSS